MKKFVFTVSNPAGLQPEEAGQLVKAAIECTGKVTIRKGSKSGDAKLIFHVLTLSVKSGDEVEIQVEGEKEEMEAEKLELFIREHIR